jgi:CheY-like chemotaxis protein
MGMMPQRIPNVDDCYEDVDSLFDRLSERGWHVDFVDSGQEVLRSIKTVPSDLILSDWEMPEMSGHELMERLSENPELREIPFLLLHYEWPDGMWSRSTRNGRTADCHLCKPINVEEVTSLHRPHIETGKGRGPEIRTMTG